MSSFNPLVSSNAEAHAVASETAFFWSNFKSAVEGVTIPKNGDGYDKGGEYNIECGMTVIRGVVRGTAGKLVDAWKSYNPDDVAYLVEAGFKRNVKLNAPAVPAPACSK